MSNEPNSLSSRSSQSFLHVTGTWLLSYWIWYVQARTVVVVKVVPGPCFARPLDREKTEWYQMVQGPW